MLTTRGEYCKRLHKSQLKKSRASSDQVITWRLRSRLLGQSDLRSSFSKISTRAKAGRSNLAASYNLYLLFYTHACTLGLDTLMDFVGCCCMRTLHTNIEAACLVKCCAPNPGCSLLQVLHMRLSPSLGARNIPSMLRMWPQLALAFVSDLGSLLVVSCRCAINQKRLRRLVVSLKRLVVSLMSS